MTEENAQWDDPLWRYAVGLYSQPGCAVLCLQLQDDYGLSINRLLFALWLADQQRRYPAQVVLQDADRWQREQLKPLRELRYGLRGQTESNNEERCYELLKQTELAAEKVELERLQQCLIDCPEADLVEGLALENLYSVLPTDAGPGDELRLRLQQLAGIAAQYGSN
ncbi:MAG: TIGR02444 family protein [Amphritea sp.]|nr:TIGR02444 family protein [Amphritea sp.]